MAEERTAALAGHAPRPAAALLRRLTLVGYLSLFPLLTLRYCCLAPPPQVSPWLPFALTLAPLLLPLRGLLTGHRYTYKWAGFIALMYFAYGVDSLFIQDWSQILGTLEVLASLLWFCGGIGYVRRTRD